MYSYGNGVPQDLQAAYDHFKLAADQGYAEAQNQIGTVNQLI
jgi:TPR repeat protein